MISGEDMREELDDVKRCLSRHTDGADMFRLDKKAKHDLEAKEMHLRKQLNNYNKLHGTEY